MSLRKSSRSRNGSKSEVLPKPKARRRCTPAPSSVGLDLLRCLTGRIDMRLLLLAMRSETRLQLCSKTFRFPNENCAAICVSDLVRNGSGWEAWDGKVCSFDVSGTLETPAGGLGSGLYAA